MAVRVLLVLTLLCISLPVGAQGDGLQLTIVDRVHGVGPETWKTPEIPDQETQAAAIGPWQASLGARLDLDLRVTRHGATTPTAWDYTATLSDGAVVVDGIVEVQGSGALAVRFDTDGQRSVQGAPALPPLTAGTWTVRVEASHDGTFQGRGQTTLIADALAFDGLMADGEIPGVAVPEADLPHIREVGAGPTTWMPLRPLQVAVARVQGVPGTEIEWTAWTAQAIPLPHIQDPTSGTPVAGVDQPLDVATAWTPQNLGTQTLDRNGRAMAGISGEGPALTIITAHAPDTGATISFVMAFGSDAWRFDEILAPSPGEEGLVQVTATGAPTPLGIPHAASLLAVSQDVPMTTGQAVGGRTLATGLMVPSGEDTWTGAFDGRATRAAGVPAYAIVAFFQDALGQYIGHVAGVRGLTAAIEAPLLGVGTPADLDVILHHAHADGDGRVDPALALPFSVAATFDNTALDSQEAQLPEGGSLTRSWQVTPTAPGSVPVTVTIDTGDLRFQRQTSVDVLPRDAYEQETAPWYDIPGPGLAWLVLLVALARQRRASVK